MHTPPGWGTIGAPRITQISAVQAALDKVALGLLADHADHCIVHGHGRKSPQENSEELMSAVGRLVKR